MDDDDVPRPQILPQPLLRTNPTRFRSSKAKLCSFLFLLLGIGLMVPWNAFVASSPYFETRLCDNNSYNNDGNNNDDVDNNHSFLQENYEAVFALVFNMANVLALCVLLYYQFQYSSVIDNGRDEESSYGSNSTLSTIHFLHYRSVKYWCVNCYHVLKQWVLCLDSAEVKEEEEVMEFSYNLLSTIEEETHSQQQLEDTSSTSYESFKFSDDEKGKKIDTVEAGREEGDYLNKLVNSSLISYAVVFFAACIMGLNTKLSSDSFFALSLILIVICGFACSIASAGLFSLAEIFSKGAERDQTMKTVFLAGQTVAGLFIAIVNFLAVKAQSYDDSECLSNESSDDEECKGYDSIDWGTESTFFITFVILVSCIVAFMVLNRLSITSYYRSLSVDNDQQHHSKDETNNNDIISIGNKSLTDTVSTSSSPSQEALQGLHHHKHRDHSDNYSSEQSILLQMEQDADSYEWDNIFPTVTEESSSEEDLLTLLRTTKYPILTVFLNYIVTLSIYPVWTSKLQSTQYCQSSYRIHNDLFQPMLLVVFNMCDLCGKFTAGYLIRYLTTGKGLFYGSTIRVLLIPALLYCTTNENDSSLVVFFPHDAYPIVFLALLGYTNGCVSSLGMMLGPNLVTSSNRRMKEYSSTSMVLVLSVGLLLGSVCSFGILKLGTGSW